MPQIRFPDLDDVTTRTELMAYLTAKRKAFADLDRHLITEAGILRAWLKAEDERLGTNAARSSVRPLLWAAVTLLSVRKAITLTAKRIHLNYAPENRRRARSRRTLDMDR